MSCKGKTPKGVRGGRVRWREQMTPAWSKGRPKQPGGALEVPCLGMGRELRSLARILLATDLLSDLG